MSEKKTFVLAGIVALMATGFARADLSNVGFETGDLTDWSVNPGGIVSIQNDATGHFAVLSEAQPFEEATSSLFQDFVITSQLTSISFEYRMDSIGNYFDENAFPDAFTARLITPDTHFPILHTPGVSDLFYHDNSEATPFVDFDSNFVSVSPAAQRTNWTTVTIDLTSIPNPTNARIQFDLLGTGMIDGQTSVVGIDNITAVVIPAPSAVLLGAIGLGIVRRFHS